MSGDRIGLAAKFGGAENPDRSAGLRGRLDAFPADSEPELTDQNAPPVAAAGRRDDGPATSSPPRKRPGRPRINPTDATGSRVVAVALDTPVREALREHATRLQLTQPTVALRAVESHADELGRHWKNTGLNSTAAGALFAGSSSPPRFGRPKTSPQMRLAEHDIATLDRLVDEWDAPSRSALINEALRRYLAVPAATT